MIRKTLGCDEVAEYDGCILEADIWFPSCGREGDILFISREIRSRWDPLIYQVVVVLLLLNVIVVVVVSIDNPICFLLHTHYCRLRHHL